MKDELGQAQKMSHSISGLWPLPEGWQRKRLGEVATINPRKSEIKSLPTDLEVTFVPMSAINEATGTIDAPEIRILGEVQKGYTYFREGDVLFAKITPCMENGKAAIARGLANEIGFGSTEFHVLRPLNDTLAEWIYFFVRQKAFRKEAANYFTGTAGQQRVPQGFLENAPIPLPPLPVQERIVAKLDRIERALRLQREGLKKMETLMQAALHRAFRGELGL